MNMVDTDLIRTLSLSIIKTQSALKQLVQRELKNQKVNLTFEMLEVLTCLWRTDGVNQQYLANETAKEKASLTFLIHNMEKRGLVTRIQDTLDKRNKLVHLTLYGRQIRTSIVPIVDTIHEKLFPKFNESQVMSSIRWFVKLSNAFNEA